MWSRPCFVPECGTAGAHGWNIDYLASSLARWLVRPGTHLDWCGGRNSSGVGSAPDTLLGPEGSGDHVRFFGPAIELAGPPVRHIDEHVFACSGLVAGEREGRPYVENYTVDASI